MAQQVSVTTISDLSGEVVEEGQAVTMTLEFKGTARNKWELDISREEADAFIASAQGRGGGREIKRRGRKPGSKNKPKES